MAHFTGALSSRSRRRLLATAAAVAACTAQAITTVGPAASAEPDALDPVVEGILPAGAEVLDVVVLALPTDEELLAAPDGATLAAKEVSAADVDTAGRSFSVSVSPEEVPAAAIDDAGSTFLTLMVVTDEGTYQANASVRAVAGPAGDAQWADPEAAVSNNPTVARTARVGHLRLPVSRATKSKTIRLSKFTKVAASKGKRFAAARSGPTPPAGCSYTKLSSSVRSTTIGTTYPVGADTATMVVNSSTGASYGIGVSSKVGGSWGAFQASSDKFTQSGWGFQWANYDGSRSYRKGVDYGLFELTCVRGCTKCSRSWYPIGETGGTGENPGIDRPDWGNCQAVSKGAWWRDSSNGTAYTNSAAVDISGLIGIDLSIERQYNSSQKILYNLKAPRRMCGSNTWPSTAGKVMSRVS
jgi:hypothetical protein